VPFWFRARSAWSMRLRSATALADASAAFCAASRDAFLRSAVFRGGVGESNKSGARFKWRLVKTKKATHTSDTRYQGENRIAMLRTHSIS